MICQHCNNEIVEGALFCTKCGTKVEPVVKKVEPKEATPLFCTNCGNSLNPGGKFCTNCGQPIGNVTSGGTGVSGDTASSQPGEAPAKENGMPVRASKPAMQQNTQTSGKKNTGLIVCLVLIVLLMVVAAGLGFKILVLDRERAKQIQEVAGYMEPSDTQTEALDVVTDNTETAGEQEGEEASLPEVDYDLTTTMTLTLDGKIKIDGPDFVLQWKDSLSVSDTDKKGNLVRLDDVTAAVIDEDGLPDGLLSDIEGKGTVSVKGVMYIKKETLHITPDKIMDKNGNNLMEEYAGAGRLDDDYIIPYSDSVLLTREDVEGLTLQEVNYAKNEIYARHGRKFDSVELREYFNSKDWYEGTIDAADFNNSYLSDVENKNAAFLSSVEKEMGTYELDQ